MTISGIAVGYKNEGTCKGIAFGYSNNWNFRNDKSVIELLDEELKTDRETWVLKQESDLRKQKILSESFGIHIPDNTKSYTLELPDVEVECCEGCFWCSMWEEGYVWDNNPEESFCMNVESGKYKQLVTKMSSCPKYLNNFDKQQEILKLIENEV